MKLKARQRALPAALVAAVVGSALAQAGDWGPAPVASGGGRGITWTLGYAGMFNEFDLDGEYYSGVYDVLDKGNGALGAGLAQPPAVIIDGDRRAKWDEEVDDVDGWLHGVFGEFVFAELFGGTVFDFRYLEGDLDGDVKISPVGFDTVFKADADIEREVFELGVSVPLPWYEWLFGRVEYFNIDDDVDWDYGGGEVEKQSYETKGVRFGVEAGKEIPLGASPATLVLQGFGGGVYFDYSHRERSIGATYDDDGWGYFLRGTALVSVPLGATGINAVGGGGYEWMDLEGDDVDIENHGWNLFLGVSGEL